MIGTWKEYDEDVAMQTSKSYVETGMLKAQLCVLLVKSNVNYQTPVEEIQQALKERYDVEYKPLDIQDELIVIDYENTEDEKFTVLNEDYFEGY